MNAAYNVEKKQGRPLTDEEYLAVLAARSRPAANRSMRSARAAARTSPTKEEAEIAILAEYLPQALTEAEVSALVDEAVAATGATSARDMGKVMGWLSPKTRGRADGKVVSGMVAPRSPSADLAAHDARTH